MCSLGFSRALTRLCTGWCGLTREQSNDRKQRPKKARALNLNATPSIEGATLKPSHECFIAVSKQTWKDLLVSTSWHTQLNSKGSQEDLWMTQREKSFWWIFKRFQELYGDWNSVCMKGGQSFFRKYIINSVGCQDQRITEEIQFLHSNPLKKISPPDL